MAGLALASPSSDRAAAEADGSPSSPAAADSTMPSLAELAAHRTAEVGAGTGSEPTCVWAAAVSCQACLLSFRSISCAAPDWPTDLHCRTGLGPPACPAAGRCFPAPAGPAVQCGRRCADVAGQSGVYGALCCELEGGRVGCGNKEHDRCTWACLRVVLVPRARGQPKNKLRRRLSAPGHRTYFVWAGWVVGGGELAAAPLRALPHPEAAAPLRVLHLARQPCLPWTPPAGPGACVQGLAGRAALPHPHLLGLEQAGAPGARCAGLAEQRTHGGVWVLVPVAQLQATKTACSVLFAATCLGELCLYHAHKARSALPMRMSMCRPLPSPSKFSRAAVKSYGCWCSPGPCA